MAFRTEGIEKLEVGGLPGIFHDANQDVLIEGIGGAVYQIASVIEIIVIGDDGAVRIRSRTGPLHQNAGLAADAVLLGLDRVGSIGGTSRRFGNGGIPFARLNRAAFHSSSLEKAAAIIGADITGNLIDDRGYDIGVVFGIGESTFIPGADFLAGNGSKNRVGRAAADLPVNGISVNPVIVEALPGNECLITSRPGGDIGDFQINGFIGKLTGGCRNGGT